MGVHLIESADELNLCHSSNSSVQPPVRPEEVSGLPHMGQLRLNPGNCHLQTLDLSNLSTQKRQVLASWIMVECIYNKASFPHHWSADVQEEQTTLYWTVLHCLSLSQCSFRTGCYFVTLFCVCIFTSC